jgi:outer membrane protein
LLNKRISSHIATCLLAASLAGAAVAAHAQEARIAAVDSDRILRESAPAKVAQSKLEQKLKTISDNLDKNGAAMSANERQQRQRDLAQLDTDFQRKQREFREDLNQRRNEELASVLDKANKVIRQIAEQQHYDLVVQEAVYVSPRINITDQVLKALAGGSTN